MLGSDPSRGSVAMTRLRLGENDEVGVLGGFGTEKDG